MSEINGKAVKSATLHENTFYPGVGEIKKELHTQGDGLNRAVKMKVDEPFLMVEVKDKVGKAVTLAIPLTNLKQLVLE